MNLESGATSWIHSLCYLRAPSNLTLPQEKAEELSANAKKYAQEKYSISKMQEKYLALIEDIYKQQVCIV